MIFITQITQLAGLKKEKKNKNLKIVLGDVETLDLHFN